MTPAEIAANRERLARNAITQARSAGLAEVAQAQEKVLARVQSHATPASAYEVTWPDGDIYANRDGEIWLPADEARATAQAIGGTWRTAPGKAA
jgi:uncharacterized membrane-anchored protein